MLRVELYFLVSMIDQNWMTGGPLGFDKRSAKAKPTILLPVYFSNNKWKYEHFLANYNCTRFSFCMILNAYQTWYSFRIRVTRLELGLFIRKFYSFDFEFESKVNCYLNLFNLNNNNNNNKC